MDWIDPAPSSGPSLFPGLHPLVSAALLQRGMTTPSSVRAFLDYRHYAPALPAEIPGLLQVAERVHEAIIRKESICVWGDFDVDGQTSTAILFETLQDLGANVFYHIPLRENEGHGVDLPVLGRMIDHGAKLILTCDTGITAHAAVELARSRGVDIVITDHHALPEVLPGACGVTNPRFLPEEHALGTLSGSGLAYKLAEELYKGFNQPSLAEKHLDLAALGLVADKAVLRGDARYLVQRGLVSLRSCSRLGLQVMFKMAELTSCNLTEEHIGFVIGPRLNALGRLSDANPAVELFTTSDPARAHLLAAQLETLNFQRQLLCSQVAQAVDARLQHDPALAEGPVIILDHPGWPGGIIGIAASRLVEHYHKPAILFTITPAGMALGSARSVEGIDIIAAITSQSGLLLSFGGHPMAAGLSLRAENLPVFCSRLSGFIEKSLQGTLIGRGLRIDGWLALQDITTELAEQLNILAPFGPGNEKLILGSRSLKIGSSTIIGRRQEHLKLTLVDPDGYSQEVFWWNGAGERLPQGLFDLALTIGAVDWRGARQVQAEWVDFRPCKENATELMPDRKEVVDHRLAVDPLSLLDVLRKEPSTVIWAEGEAKKNSNGIDRNELVPAENLVIWSTPPSASELQQAVDKVSPHKVYLFGIDPGSQTIEDLQRYLLGLIKFILNKRAGKTTLSELAALTGQRESAVQKALEWFASEGRLAVSNGEGGSLEISLQASEKDPQRASGLKQELINILEETSAYRNYFSSAGKDILLK